MNTNENEVVMSGDEELRAKLCAVLLGEASDEVRAEVDAALANSAELRAERARIEATIGLVAGALKDVGAGELSPQASAALQAAAAKRVVPVAWHRTAGFRVAASFAVVAIGAMAARSILVQEKPAVGEELATAKNERQKGSYGEVARDQAPAPAASAPVLADAAAPTEPAPELKLDAQLGFPLSRTPPPAGWEITGQHFESGASSSAQQAQLRNSIAGTSVDDLWEAAKQASDGEVDSAGAQSHVAVSEVADEVGIYNPDPATLTAVQLQQLAEERSRGDSGVTVHSAGSPGHYGTGTPSTYSARRAGAGGKSSAASAPSSPAPSGPTTGGAGSSKEQLEELTKLGYFSGVDEEVTGRAFDDDADRFGERKRKDGELAARFHFDQSDWRYRYDEFRRDCFPRINERPRDMFFRFWGDNPFELTAIDSLSTFAADVDSASYTLARNYLVNGNLPTKEQIRTEEFVNYFKGDVAPPTEGAFRIATELAPSLFGDSPDTWMLRVAIRGREVSKNERQPLALTFVIDVSGSMKEENRLELVKHALRQLVNQLDARDSISLIKFSNDASLVLPMTSAAQRTLIESAIDPLRPDGSTNTEAGLRMGYAQAEAALTANATNRVVLLTDGVANVGIVDPNALVAMVESQRKAGIYLNTVGVGMDNHNDNLLEQLADKGDGLCNYVDDAKEVKRALVDNFTGAFEPIARDVKIQVEFDPAQVERYRLLGYENRAVADADFRNDKVDAGEIGAGHQVVALYELVRKPGGDAPLATVRLRYKQPFKAGVAGGNSDESTELAQPVVAKSAAGSFAATTAGYRRSVLVAQFAEFLRRSIHARYDRLDVLIDESKKLAGEMKDADFNEFVAALEKSRELVLRDLEARRAPIERCYDELRHRAYLLQQIEELERRLDDGQRLGELDRTARDLERQLDELRIKLDSLQGQIDEPTLAQIQAENIALQRRLIELLERLRKK